MPRSRDTQDTQKRKASAKSASREGKSKQSASTTESSPSLVNQVIGLTSQWTSSVLDIAKSGKFMPLMFGADRSIRDAYKKVIDPARLEAMADAGHLLKDARQVAGLNVAELSEAVGLADTELLEDVEKGAATLPFDMILRIASLTARHDPIPFILKFLRTYNPDLERGLQQWGISQWPQAYERERRFINIYRQHDNLRELSDSEYERFIGYMNSATDFTLNIMMSELEDRLEDDE